MKAIGRFIIGFFVLALFGCIGVMLFAGAAHAQVMPKCLPLGNDKGSSLFMSHNATGVCVRWHCYLDEFTPEYPTAVQSVTYCGTWGQMNLVGGRVQTIQKAADPLKSLQDLPKRITVVPLSDPSMAGMPK